jgi:PKD repeat protein
MSKKIIFMMILVLAFTVSWAEWSADPMINQQISFEGGDQALPKIEILDDGSCFISWLVADTTGSYNLRVQYLSANGSHQFEENGILVFGGETMSWITDYDMALDNDGNAIVAYNDMRDGTNLVAYGHKITQTGELPWGEGIMVSSATGFGASPKVVVTDANNAVFATMQQLTDAVELQKVSPSGEKLWGETPKEIAITDVRCTWPQLMAIESDQIIMKYFQDSGPNWAADRLVFAKKIDADGNDVWSQDVAICDNGALSTWNQIFSMISDNAGGFFIGWHDSRVTPTIGNAYVQHIDTDGNIGFEQNGLILNTNTGNNQYEPKLSYDPSGILYAFWNEQSGDQNSRGIHAQKINDDGDKLWGDNGINVLPLTADDCGVIDVDLYNSQPVVYMKKQVQSSTYISARMYNADAEEVWDEDFAISNTAGQKSKIVASSIVNDQAVLAWGGDHIFAQNIVYEIETTPLACDFSSDVTSGDAPLTVQFTDESEGEITGWLWNFGDGNTSIEQNPQHIYNYAGHYEVSLEITDDADTLEHAVENYIVVSAEVDEILDVNPDSLIFTNYDNITDTLIIANNSFEVVTISDLYFDQTEVLTELFTSTQFPITIQPFDTLEIDVTSALPTREIVNFDTILETNFGNIAIPTVFDTDLIQDNDNNVHQFKDELIGNYPNPFTPKSGRNSSVNISFSLKKADFVNIKIYNIKGQLVNSICDDKFSAGNHNIQWNGRTNNGSNASAGVYFYKMETSNYKNIKRMLIIK